MPVSMSPSCFNNSSTSEGLVRLSNLRKLTGFSAFRRAEPLLTGLFEQRGDDLSEAPESCEEDADWICDADCDGETDSGVLVSSMETLDDGRRTGAFVTTPQIRGAVQSIALLSLNGDTRAGLPVEPAALLSLLVPGVFGNGLGDCCMSTSSCS